MSTIDPTRSPRGGALAGAPEGPDDAEVPGAGQDRRRRHPSRRTLLLGGAAVVAAAGAGVPLALRARGTDGGRQGGGGKLVPALLGSSPFYVAHRGGSGDWPEMSMQAYRGAVARGVNALEMSLARTSDGVWFGLHDATLDRTSGTSGVVAAQRTWAEISTLRILPSGPHAAEQTPQPYLRLEDMLAAFASSHTIFVDPKAAGRRYHAELLALMNRATPRPADTFVAKSYARDIAWPAAARAAGFRTWGYYYGPEVESGATPLSAAASPWDVLGLDVQATAATWRSFLATGKPVIGHVIGTERAAQRALADGARGLMLSGVLEVLSAPA